jgi:hypothetical protein
MPKRKNSAEYSALPLRDWERLSLAGQPSWQYYPSYNPRQAGPQNTLTA